MRRFVRSEGYAKARLATGSLFMILGAVVIVRTLASVGFDGRALPPVVLGGAMLLLGWFRFRDYFATRRPQT